MECPGRRSNPLLLCFRQPLYLISYQGE